MAPPEDFRARLGAVDARMRALLADETYQAKRDEYAERIDEATRKERAAARVDALKRRGVPEGLLHTLSAPKESDPLAFVRAWLLDARLPLFGLLAGKVGTGKTFALSWAVGEEPAARFVDALALVRVAPWGDDWLDLIRPPLLAIDDLGMEPLDEGGWGESKFGNLVNARRNAARRTLFATNLNAPEFWARYPDERLRDRIQSSCLSRVFNGPSLRQPLQIVPKKPGKDDP